MTNESEMLIINLTHAQFQALFHITGYINRFALGETKPGLAIKQIQRYLFNNPNNLKAFLEAQQAIFRTFTSQMKPFPEVKNEQL